MGKDPSDIREEIEEADVPGRIQDAIGAVRERAGSVRDSIGSALPDSGAIQDQTARTVSFVRENPLGLFFGAAAVGFVLGAILPASDIENARLGPVREQLKNKAIAAGGQLLKRGQAVIRDTVEAAKGAST